MRLRRLIAFVALFVTVIAGNAQTNALGIRGGYTTRAETGVGGMWFQHSFSRLVRLAPSVDYYFRHNNVDALAINVDAQFTCPLDEARRASIYPFAGFNYTSWNYHYEQLRQRSEDDVTTRINRLGLNLGLGFDYRVTPTLKIGIEGKASLMKNKSTGVFTFALGYCF